MGDRDFLEKYVKLLDRQRRLIRAAQNLLLVSFAVFSLGIICALPLRYFLGWSYEMPLSVASGIILLSIIYGFLGITDKTGLFREMDRNLNLKEKMSAAWQFGGTDSPYSPILMEDAEEIILKTEPHRVFKIHFSRRDPFIPLLLALFLFLWMGNFSFLRISDEQLNLADFLTGTADRIDAVNGEDLDRDLDEISEEYRKMGETLKDRFMNQQTLEREVDKLSKRLEKKIESLSREGVDKESKELGDKEADTPVYQLDRKEELSDELENLLDSLMKTFSMNPELALGMTNGQNGRRSAEGQSPGGSGEKGAGSDTRDEGDMDGQSGTTEEKGASSDNPEESEKPADSYSESESTSNRPGESSDSQSSESPESNETPQLNRKDKNESGDQSMSGEMDRAVENLEQTGQREQQQSGEFDKEDNIRGDLHNGEQMKSFIRALPHIVEPTREESDVLHYYRNQLETAVEKELLPNEYEAVVRDYFLGIGVLKDE